MFTTHVEFEDLSEGRTLRFAGKSKIYISHHIGNDKALSFSSMSVMSCLCLDLFYMVLKCL